VKVPYVGSSKAVQVDKGKGKEKQQLRRPAVAQTTMVRVSTTSTSAKTKPNLNAGAESGEDSPEDLRNLREEKLEREMKHQEIIDSKLKNYEEGIRIIGQSQIPQILKFFTLNIYN